MTTSPTVLTAWLGGVGVVGPGLTDWQTTRAVLAGELAYQAAPLAVPPPTGLPTAERRRAGLSVKVALAVAQEALAAAGLDARTVSTVFSSSGADGDNCDAICQVLASDDRHISPTRFHNSVHNAPAGYWGIASGAMSPATVLCAYDGSFGAGLLEALTQVVFEQTPALLIAYDAPYPEPLNAKRPLPSAFGAALALTPVRTPHSLARLDVRLTDTPAEQLDAGELEGLRRAIPAARGLPLLSALARGDAREVRIEYLPPLQLAVTIAPCSR